LELAFEMRIDHRVEWRIMRRTAFTVLLSLASALVPAGALARGEMSYTMPEVRETAPPSADIVRTSLWSHEVSRWSDNALAIGTKVVAFAAPDMMCGFDESTGTQLWCDGKGQRPAYADGVVAYTAADGSVHGVDIDSGAFLWKHAGAVSQYSTASYAASTGDDFLLSGLRGPVDRVISGIRVANLTTISYAEITPSGHVLWSGDGQNCCSLPNPVIMKPYAFQVNTGSGATIMSSLQILKLGPGGGVGASIHNIGDVLDFNPPTIILSGGWRAQEVEDFFLTFEVERAAVTDGTVVETFDYAPDYDANYDRYRHAYTANNALYEAGLRVDGEFVYGNGYENIYRYRLADGAGQRPLLVASDSVLLGGPYHGAIYVSRSDGVWAFRFESTRIRARLVASSSSRVSGFYIAARTAYIAFEGGEVRGVNVDDGRTVFDATPGNAARVGVSGHRVFVVCQTDSGWRVVAFQRPDRP
jgi:hypothetical protein